MAMWLSFPELAGVLGEEGARRLCLCLGGAELHIPAVPRPDHRIAAIIGTRPFTALCAAYPGHDVRLPNERKPEPKKDAIVSALEAGKQSHCEIALAQGVTLRWVEMLARDLRAAAGAPRQLSLFAAHPRSASGGHCSPDRA